MVYVKLTTENSLNISQELFEVTIFIKRVFMIVNSNIIFYTF
jgi:hypothetical protein